MACCPPALMLSMATVWGRSALGGVGSLGGYRVVLKRVLIRVDLPRPDSPVQRGDIITSSRKTSWLSLTDNHGCKLEALEDTLAVNLIGEIGKSNITCELFANNRDGVTVGGDICSHGREKVAYVSKAEMSAGVENGPTARIYVLGDAIGTMQRYV